MSAKAKVSGSVVAGFPSPAEQYLEPLGLRLPSKANAFSADILDLNELLVKRPAATRKSYAAIIHNWQVPASPEPAVQKLVGAAGFEPTTTCAQGRCATRLRYAPREASRNYLRNAA